MDNDFNVFVPMLKSGIGESDGKRRLHGTASSTVKDRHGDVITLGALRKMEAGANRLTIFLNHDYRVPEDVAGTVEKAEIRSHPSDPDIHDLVFDIVVNETNPRAINAWESIQEGTQLGLSIGARIPNGGATKSADGAYVINDIELLETSLVGVPASPRSWVDYAVKSLRRVEILKSTNPNAIGVDVEEPEDETEPDGVEKATAMELAVADEPAVEVVNETPTPEGEDQSPTDEEAEPETEPAYSDPESVDVLDSDEPSTPQDAPDPTSHPENGDLFQSDEAEITLTALLSSADSLQAAHSIIEVQNREMVEMKASLTAAEEERDRVVTLSQKTMDQTTSLLERLQKAPMGRKTHPVVIETAKEFEGLKGVYTEGVMALLTKER